VCKMLLARKDTRLNVYRGVIGASRAIGMTLFTHFLENLYMEVW
jgi:hypothetical protein